ncbi:MAG: 30S ribosomal protein S9 [Rickettsiales bacterium]
MEINLEVKQQEAEVKAIKKAKKNEVDSLGRAYATGKRKTSIARAWIKQGKGKFIVNGQEFTKYFSDEDAFAIATQGFKATDTEKKYDVLCTVKGGGASGQAQALRHAISKALVVFNEVAYKSLLRKAGLLTRDSRIVERKKYGHKKARKSFQFSKR